MIEDIENAVRMAARHFEVLNRVKEDQPIGITRLAQETGYPRHRVRYSLRRLEKGHLIEPTGEGAVTTDKTADFIDEFHERVDDVIAMLQSLPSIGEMDHRDTIEWTKHPKQRAPARANRAPPDVVTLLKDGRIRFGAAAKAKWVTEHTGAELFTGSCDGEHYIGLDFCNAESPQANKITYETDGSGAVIRAGIAWEEFDLPENRSVTAQITGTRDGVLIIDVTHVVPARSIA